MLFKKRYHQGLRDGSITLSFRVWKTPKVKLGGRYRFTVADAIEIESIDQVPVSSITEADAGRAGFTSRAELIEALRDGDARSITSRSKVFRVEFRHRLVETGPPPAPRSARQVDDLIARLEQMDRRSRRDPWTRELLDLIARKPRTAASRLAPIVDRETPPFKADVRKLKTLGLTVSFEVGYELSPLGRAVLARWRGRP